MRKKKLLYNQVVVWNMLDDVTVEGRNKNVYSVQKT